MCAENCCGTRAENMSGEKGGERLFFCLLLRAQRPTGVE